MIILASKSPRRKDLLKTLVDDFIIIPSNIDESQYDISEVSLKKAEVISDSYRNDYILSADTYVMYNDIVFGKPKDKLDAFKILSTLQDKTHTVVTYFTILNKSKDVNITKKVVTEVTFKKMNEEKINEYIASNSPMDKAGAYGIQDNDKYDFIKSIKGSLTNVIGLPLEELKKTLIDLKIIK